MRLRFALHFLVPVVLSGAFAQLAEDSCPPQAATRPAIDEHAITSLLQSQSIVGKRGLAARAAQKSPEYPVAEMHPGVPSASRANSSTCGKVPATVFVAIPSAPSQASAKRRSELRRKCVPSWSPYMRTHRLDFRFFIGSIPPAGDASSSREQGVISSEETRERLKVLSAEAAQFKDIVFVPMMDEYGALPLKTLSILESFLATSTAEFLVKVDDDGCLNVHTFFASLEQRGYLTSEDAGSSVEKDSSGEAHASEAVTSTRAWPANCSSSFIQAAGCQRRVCKKDIYMGYNLWSSKHNAPLQPKQSLPASDAYYGSQVGADGKYVPYFGGPLYVLSRNLVRSIVDLDRGSGSATLFQIEGSSSEDVDMGRWVAAQPLEVDYIEEPTLRRRSNVAGASLIETSSLRVKLQREIESGTHG